MSSQHRPSNLSTPRARPLNTIILVAVSCLASNAAAAASNLAPDVLARALGQTMTEDRIFYRWQSTASGENLVAKGTLDDGANDYFMKLTKGIAAGPGLYLADSPYSSSEYLPDSGGNLIEARVKRGTIFVDLQDPAVIAKAAKLGLPAKNLHRALNAADGVLVRYTKSWFVAKNVSGKVDFAYYPGQGQTTDAVRVAYDRIKQKNAQRQFLAQIKSQRPDLRKKLLEREPFSRAALGLLNPGEFASHVSKSLDRPRAAAAVNQLFEHLAKSPADATLIERDPLALRKIAVSLGDGSTLPANGLERLPTSLTEAILNQPPLERSARQAIADILVRNYFKSVDAYASLPKSADKLVRWIEQSSIVDVKNVLAQELEKMLLISMPTAAQGKAMREVLRAAGLENSDVDTAITHAIMRRTYVDQARQTKNPADVARALREAGTLDDLFSISHEIKPSLPPNVWTSAAKIYRSEHSIELERLISPAASWPRALNPLSEKVLGYDLFPNVLRAASSTADNKSFFKACLTHIECATKLSEAVQRNGRDLLRTTEDFKNLTSAISSFEGYSAAANRIGLQMFRGMVAAATQPDQLLAIRPILGNTERFRTFLERAERIGLKQFSSRDLVLMAENRHYLFPTRKRLFQAALSTATEPEDIRHVLDTAGYSPWMEKDLRRRLRELPSPGETWRQSLKDAGWKIGDSGASTASAKMTADCLGRLGRLLSFFGR